MGETRNAYSNVVRKPVGMQPIGKLRGRWEDDVKMQLKDIGF
jgi:hypothetical protein